MQTGLLISASWDSKGHHLCPCTCSFQFIKLTLASVFTYQIPFKLTMTHRALLLWYTEVLFWTVLFPPESTSQEHQGIMLAVTFLSVSKTMWNLPSNRARKYFHSPHNQLAMRLVLTSLTATETTVVGAKLDPWSRIMMTYQTPLINPGNGPVYWTLKSLGDDMPNQTTEHCNHSRRIAAYQKKKKTKHHLRPSPKALKHFLNMFKDSKKHAIPDALYGRTQSSSTIRVREFPFTGLLMRYLEVIPHFYSDLIIDLCSFLYHNPSYQKERGQVEKI